VLYAVVPAVEPSPGTVSELSIEAFFPADASTAATLASTVAVG
jgi:hypothetical protein